MCFGPPPLDSPEAPLTAFTTPRDRDAWGAIRGFVYQIELTMDRWLKLPSGAALELETGEDIDTISRQWKESAAQIDRLLEQVKYRQGTFTLRTPAALEAVANFAEHRASNAALALQFRFVTNASATRERPSPLPGKYSGVSAWEAIRLGAAEASEVALLAEGIRTIFHQAKRPGTLPAETWKHFEKVTNAPLPEFLALVNQFEWSSHNPSHESLGALLRDVLRSQPGRPSEETVEFQFLRLFVRISELLSTRGPKRLTTNDRDDLLKRPAPPPEEVAQLNAHRVALEELAALVRKHDRQLASLEVSVGRQETEIASLRTFFAAAVGQERIELLDVPDLDPPRPIVPSIRRPEAESALRKSLDAAVWTAIWGSAGMGKTELTRQLVAERSSSAPWLRFRDLNSVESLLRLRAAMVALCAGGAQIGRRDRYRVAAENLGRGGLLVLDDLPAVSTGSDLFEDLVELIIACGQVGANVLSTSAHPPIAAIQERLGTATVSVLKSPPFSDGDVGEWLKIVDAPITWMDVEVHRPLRLRTMGHPVLLAHILSRAKAAGWPPPAGPGGFVGDEDLTVDPETMRRLIASVGDADTRKLLTRLTQVIGTVTLDLAKAAADAPPPISDLQQHLAVLSGPWLQTDSPGTYLLSPLIRGLGDTDLISSVRSAVNEALGDTLTSRSSLSVVEVIAAVEYFVRAGNGQRAAVNLCWSLHSTFTAKDRASTRVLLGVGQRNVRGGIKPATEICLRTIQTMAADWLSEPMPDVHRRLFELVRTADAADLWVAMGGALIVTTAKNTIEFRTRTELLQFALQNVDAAHFPDGRSLSAELSVALEDVLWLQGGQARNADDVVDWSGTLRSMNVDQVGRAKDSEWYVSTAPMVADRVWLTELDKPPEDRDWVRADQVLEALASDALTVGMDVLWTWATRGRVIIAAEHRGQPEVGIEIARQGLAMARTSPVARFGLGDILATELLLKGDRRGALAALELVVTESVEGFDFWQMRALVRLASLVGESDRPKATATLERAVALASRSSELPELQVVKALAECAIGLWLEKGPEAAFDAWDEAAKRLLAVSAKERTKHWQALFVRFGHVSGYLSSLASSGRPPAQTMAGEPYAEPVQGMFVLNDDSKVYELYGNVPDHNLLPILAMYAEGVRRDDRAASWALMAVDEASKLGDMAAVSLSAVIAAPLLVMSDRYEDAIDVGLIGAKAGAEGLEALRRSQDPPAWMASRDTSQAAGTVPEADARAIVLAVFPCVLRAAHFVIQGRPVDDLVSDVVEACTRVGDSSSVPTLWQSVALLLSEMFDGEHSLKQLDEEANRLGEVYGNNLRVLAYVGASVSPDVSLKTALFLHFQVASFVEGTLPRVSPVHRLLLEPLIADFWSRSIEQQGFQFMSPRMMRAEMTDALAKPVGQRTQAILRAAAGALGVTIRPSSGP